MTFREGLESASRDLSKGVVPITLVVAMFGSSFYVGAKVERMRRDQQETAIAVAKLQTTLEDEIAPVLREVAQLTARVDELDERMGLRERDIRLNERSLMEIEIALGKAGIEVN